MHGIIKLYGEIWNWNRNSASEFIANLNELENDNSVDVIHLHIHSYGGEVIEGNMIYNAIKNCKKPVDAYIDGVAASMATIVMLPCRNIYMSANAFLMIHAPSGGCYGTAKDMTAVAKMLRSIEAIFKTAYAAKTGKTDAEIAEWMTGENWFSATEALESNLITGIVDVIDTTATPIEKSDLQVSTAKMVYQRYAALVVPTNNNKNESQKEKKSMNKQELINRYALTGVTADSSDADVLAAMDAKIAAINAEKSTAETALQTERETQVTALVNGVPGLTKEQKEAYTAMGKTMGVAHLQTALGAIKPQPSITGQLSGGTGSHASTEPKTMSELVALGEAAVTAYKETNPAGYAKLYEAEFGRKLN